MAQVSRFPLPKSLATQVESLFQKVFADLHTQEDVGELLNDLLTPTEKVMLSKRLAIAFLLDKGYDQRTIHTLLKVSIGTVNRVNFWLKNQGAGYRKGITMIRHSQKWQATLRKLDDFLRDAFSQKAIFERSRY